MLPTLIVTAVLMTMAVQPATAQDLARYRAYALNTSVESVIAISGSRPGDVKTRHVRPARIQPRRILDDQRCWSAGLLVL